jgi:hypothetical protein
VAFDISGGMPAPAPMIPSTRGTLPRSIVELAALAASLAFSTLSRSICFRLPSLRGWPSVRWSRRCGARVASLRAGDNPAMSSREERMALNEAASREINEEIEQAHRDEPPGRLMTISCECALRSCDRLIEITMVEYQDVRSDPRQFAIVPEHLIGDIERIVFENDRFAVVAKRAGTPADVVTENDPRG